jgi:hypothetical protein
MGSFVHKLFEEARQTYGDEAGELHVVRLMEERTGLFLRPPHGTSDGNAKPLEPGHV